MYEHKPVSQFHPPRCERTLIGKSLHPLTLLALSFLALLSHQHHRASEAQGMRSSADSLVEAKNPATTQTKDEFSEKRNFSSGLSQPSNVIYF
jgi:hypothetical protein